MTGWRHGATRRTPPWRPSSRDWVTNTDSCRVADEPVGGGGGDLRRAAGRPRTAMRGVVPASGAIASWPAAPERGCRACALPERRAARSTCGRTSARRAGSGGRRRLRGAASGGSSTRRAWRCLPISHFGARVPGEGRASCASATPRRRRRSSRGWPGWRTHSPERAPRRLVSEVWRPRVTVAAVVEREGRFLLIEEETSRGRLFNQPAGHLGGGRDSGRSGGARRWRRKRIPFRPTLVGVYRGIRPEDVTFLRFAFAGEVSVTIRAARSTAGSCAPSGSLRTKPRESRPPPLAARDALHRRLPRGAPLFPSVLFTA